TSNSLSEMAARAAQRTHSNRPPPPPPIIPAQLKPPSVYPGSGPGASRSRAPGHASSQNGDSGLIHLQALQSAPSIGPAIHQADARHMTAPPTAHRSRLETNPFESKGSRGLLVGFIVGLLVIAGAYGLAVKRGMQPMAAGRN